MRLTPQWGTLLPSRTTARAPLEAHVVLVLHDRHAASVQRSYVALRSKAEAGFSQHSAFRLVVLSADGDDDDHAMVPSLDRERVEDSPPHRRPHVGCRNHEVVNYRRGAAGIVETTGAV